ncbi:MAG: GMC family oxidoreductase [Sandaracinaceae bacterium]|nr:GMC family oxidoreductase [Sandaracinaceae bacterium]
MDTTPHAADYTMRFAPETARLVLAIAEVATPAGVHVRPPNSETVRRVERILAGLGSEGLGVYSGMLHALDLAGVPLAGQRLTQLPLAERGAALQQLAGGVATHHFARVVTGPIKLAQVTREGVPSSIGGQVGLPVVPVREEPHRWGERLVDAGTLHEGETLEVDAVVIGSGAGGGPVAHALASRGHAVLVLEAGAHYTRADFVGRPSERSLALQRQHVTLGNTAIVLPTGSSVGGTTTINSGTCFRTPHEVMRRWRFEHGLRDLHPESMEPYFARVEAMLEVGPNEARYLGAIAKVVARGAEALGWAHEALPRNAPGCDGQGVCCFGCPTDAKRSTNVSYIPAALDRGAMLFHHARVEEVLISGGRAVGVVARATNGHGARIRVLAKAVVLAAGALGTPAMLLRQGLANSSGQVGRNLSVHPCSNAWALFDESIRGWDGVPQGYGVEQFAHEGIRFEGASIPLDIAAATLPLLGDDWTRFVDAYDRMACFGFMTAETSRGRVVLGPKGAPQVLYRMNDFDAQRVVRAQGLLARLFLAAGAEHVLPGIHGVAPITCESDVRALLSDAGNIAAHRLDLMAFHPLGSCAMGVDPRRSVVGPTNETHDVPGLFVADGSSVNGPLGVNPQVTIMALAERASTFVERRIEDPSGTRARSGHRRGAPARPAFEFSETMSGSCTFVEDDREAAAAFTVRCYASDGRAVVRGLPSPVGGALELEGTTTVDGFATASPCRGTLQMTPRKRRGTLVYDLDFRGDDGLAYHLHGEKNVPLLGVLSGMTRLDTEITRASDGVPVARGTLAFLLGDLLPWLATFRVRPF